MKDGCPGDENTGERDELGKPFVCGPCIKSANAADIVSSFARGHCQNLQQKVLVDRGSACEHQRTEPSMHFMTLATKLLFVTRNASVDHFYHPRGPSAMARTPGRRAQ